MSLREKKRGGPHMRLAGDILRADSIVLRGERSATVYGCRKILRYAKERICLSLGKRRVCVRGEELICTAFSAGTVTVEGRITGVAYCTVSCSACTIKEEETV